MKRTIEKVIRLNLAEHLLFLVLGIFAVLLYKERLLADASYYIFGVINNENFRVEYSRFVLIFSQILPLLAVKFGLGLKAVLVIYSIGHIFFFYGLFLIARYVYNDKKAGLMLLMIQTLGIMSGFFIPMFELYYSAGFLVLFTTVLWSNKTKLNIGILCVLSFFILTAHQYAYILFLFILALHATEFKMKCIRVYLLLLTIFMAVFIFKFITISEYEQGKTAAFVYNLKHGNYSLQYIASLAGFLLKYYKGLLLIECITLTLLLINKNFLKAAIAFLAFAGTLAMVNVSFFGFEQTSYQEQVYFPLSFLAAYPFVYYVLKTEKDIIRIGLYVTAFLIITLRIVGIWSDSKAYTIRITEMEKLIDRAKTQGNTKWFIDEKSLPYDPNWSFATETMLLSSCGDDKKTITICTVEDIDFNQNRSKLLPDEYLFRRWEIYPITSQNRKYFNLGRSEYILIK